jgi:hypothetical protein
MPGSIRPCAGAGQSALDIEPIEHSGRIEKRLAACTIGLRHEVEAMALPRWLGVLALLTGGASSAVAQAPGDIPAYAVSGWALGARVQADGSRYRAYRCRPSDLFDGLRWCQKTGREKERRGSFSVTHSILHARDGRVLYVNRYQEPAFFDPNEADEDIARYSREIGEQPRIVTMPSRPGLPHGILAAWGQVVLEPLDNESLRSIAAGRRPAAKGYLIDFIGDFARSAKEGLPVYRLGGGAGFVWAASYDRNGRGTLRFAAVDASAISPQIAATPAEQRSQGAASPAPVPEIGAEKDEQGRIEANASGDLADAPASLQFLMKGLRTADDFIKLAEETFLTVVAAGPTGDIENGDFTDAHRASAANASEAHQEIAFRNFRRCFFLSDSGCNRTYGVLSGIMPTLSPALTDLVAQPEPMREFRYEGKCFFSATLDIRPSLLRKHADGSYRGDQTGHVAYVVNFNGLDPNSVKIVDAPEYIKIALEPPRKRVAASPADSTESMRGLPSSALWQSRYDRFVASLIERTSIRKFVILEKQKAKEFPSAPVSVLLADVGEATDQEHAWKPVDYHEEAPPFAIGRASLKRFPVLAFEGSDADLIAENLNGVIRSCQNDK